MSSLPRRPARDNAARDCVRRAVWFAGVVPAHIQPCTCPEHTGVCRACGFAVTVGTHEYGHARARNLGPSTTPRVDCPHRPTACDPQRPDSH